VLDIGSTLTGVFGVALILPGLPGKVTRLSGYFSLFLRTVLLDERRAKWEAEQIAKMRAQGRMVLDDGWRAKYQEPQRPDTTGLPELPQGWIVASMDQITTRITSGSKDWSKYYGEGSGTFLMAQNLRPGQLALSYRQPVNPPAGDRDRARSQVELDDLFITIVGVNTGDVCRVPNELPEHYVCQSVALMRPVVPELSRYVELYLVSPENGQHQYEQYMYGAGRPHLSFDQLKMTAVVLPPLAEQQRIVAEVERRLSVVAEVEAVAANLKRAERLRQSILKRAFEGQLVPQDPSDEPASVLLERIRQERVAQGGKKAVKQVRMEGM
jgi:type I restriction enzyme S subunit